MERIEFEIESICTMKMDRFIDGLQPKNERGYKKQAEEKVYRNEKGEISIPAAAIKAAMRKASSDIGKKMESRQTISSMVFIEPKYLSLNRKDHDGIVEDIVTRGKGEKVTRVKTYRPIIKKWKITGIINSFGVPTEFLKECLELAGLRWGLLGHRPEFGRYFVTKFEIIKEE